MLNILVALSLQFSDGAPVIETLTVEDLLAGNTDNAVAVAVADECRRVLDLADQLNSPALFYGAGQCFQAGEDVSAYSLMHFGQVRAMADLELASRSGSELPEAAVQLAGVLYYQLGGSAPVGVWADPVSQGELLQALETWSPQTPDGYQPGWEEAGALDHARYAEMLESGRAIRLSQLEEIAVLAQNPEYVSLSAELDRLHAENPNGFVAETPAYDRWFELSQRLQEISTGTQRDATSE